MKSTSPILAVSLSCLCLLAVHSGCSRDESHTWRQIDRYSDAVDVSVEDMTGLWIGLHVDVAWWCVLVLESDGTGVVYREIDGPCNLGDELTTELIRWSVDGSKLEIVRQNGEARLYRGILKTYHTDGHSPNDIIIWLLELGTGHLDAFHLRKYAPGGVKESLLKNIGGIH